MKPGTTRVLHIIATLERGGAEGQLVELVIHLDRSRFEPHVLCLAQGGPLENRLHEAGVPVTVLGKRWKIDLIFFRHLVRALRRIRPDILHTWMFTANTWGRLATLFAPVSHVVVSERCADHWKSSAHLMLDRLLAHRTDCIVGNSQAVVDFYQAVGIPPHLLRVVPNGRDWSAWDRLPEAGKIRKHYGLPEKGVGVGALGRVCSQKGQDVFAKAVGRISQEEPLWFLVVGEGRPRFVRSLHKEAGEGRLYRMAPVPDPRAVYSMLDMVVVPSRYEGLSNVLLEAMACRCAVIASDIPENRAVVQHGENGWLVPSEHSPALAEAIRHLGADPDLRHRLGERARRTVLAEFTFERMVDQTQALYDELAGVGTLNRMGVPA